MTLLIVGITQQIFLLLVVVSFFSIHATQRHIIKQLYNFKTVTTSYILGLDEDHQDYKRHDMFNSFIVLEAVLFGETQRMAIRNS